MGAPVSYGAAAQGGVGRSKGPSRRARDLFPTGSLPRVSRETLFPRHWGTDLSCSFTKARPPVHLGPGPQQSSGLSVPCVQGCGPGNRWWHQSTARLLHLESCDLGPLRSGLRGRRPGPAQSTCRGPQERAMLLGEHRWGDTWLRNGGGRKLCLGAGTCPIHGLVAKYRRVSG